MIFFTEWSLNLEGTIFFGDEVWLGTMLEDMGVCMHILHVGSSCVVVPSSVWLNYSYDWK